MGVAWIWSRSLMQILQLGNTFDIDAFVEQMDKAGPIVPRLIMSGAVEEPLFAVKTDLDLHLRAALTVILDYSSAGYDRRLRKRPAYHRSASGWR